MLVRTSVPSIHSRSWSTAPAAVRARQVVCNSRKQKHQSEARQQQQQDVSVQPDQQYYLPTPAEQSLESIHAAQDAAEAAQQQLRSSDSFATAAAVSPTLRSILDIYRDVQQLYHKAIRTVMQRHPDLATSPAGVGCTLLADPVLTPLNMYTCNCSASFVCTCLGPSHICCILVHN
jgi:hypothetical protein